MSIQRGGKPSGNVKDTPFARDTSDMDVSPKVAPDPKYVGIADKADYTSTIASRPK